MVQAKKGHTAEVKYKGKLRDGTVYDSSEGREPIEFTIGEGRIIAGFEDAVERMSAGESQSIDTPADRAFGPHRDEMVLLIGRDQVPPEEDPEVGDMLQMQGPDGNVAVATVTEVTDQSIALDANQPPAAIDLKFSGKVAKVKQRPSSFSGTALRNSRPSGP